jgi:hypothetical protein
MLIFICCAPGEYLAWRSRGREFQKGRSEAERQLLGEAISDDDEEDGPTHNPTRRTGEKRWFPTLDIHDRTLVLACFVLLPKAVGQTFIQSLL